MLSCTSRLLAPNRTHHHDLSAPRHAATRAGHFPHPFGLAVAEVTNQRIAHALPVVSRRGDSHGKTSKQASDGTRGGYPAGRGACRRVGVGSAIES